MSDFKDLRVWQLARQLTLAIYQLTEDFPKCERYGLVSQMRRSANSVLANIAESRGRTTLNDQNRLVVIALGSARELESHLILARDLQLIEAADAAAQIAAAHAVQRMLNSLVGRGRSNAR